MAIPNTRRAARQIRLRQRPLNNPVLGLMLIASVVVGSGFLGVI
jgi:hypothetical protein